MTKMQNLNTQLAQVSALVGVLLPLVVAVIQKQKWRNSIRVAVGVVACLIASVIVSYTKGQLNLHDLSASLFIIFVLTKTTYLAVWKPSGVAPSIEAATGGGPDNPDYLLPSPS